MRYETLFQKKEKLHQILKKIPKEALDSFERSFDVEYTHNSTAIEGNTLTLIQTKAIIEDGISVGGKTLREIFEVTNHAKAFSYVKESVSKNLPLDEATTKDIHALLMENIIIGGIYRNVEVRITGAGFNPPTPNEMYRQIKDFFATLPYRTDLNPIELAAYTHAEFVKIHPILEDHKLKIKNMECEPNYYTIEISSIEELLKFKEDVGYPIIISSLDSYIKQYLPEEVKYSIEIYNTYRE